ncbi:hypothetical protein [Mycolicibacterium llatzerense]|uniref:hypothetical protein n=1 Tax=Mycolicibacterium llatzerense TaxID=280871 RepID=UPI0008DD5454|nr:hypothetical protein [Mycolicibacterium llatzerense]
MPIALAVGVGVAGLVAGVGVGAYGLGRSSSPAPATPVAAPSAPPAPAVVSPEDAQAQICGVLKANYESVANAIDDRNKFKINDWGNPDLLTSTNNLVAATQSLANQLESTLVSSASPNVKSAMTEYIAGLRALGISQRNHAPADQLNGVALFYNQVLSAPLHICGIPG